MPDKKMPVQKIQTNMMNVELLDQQVIKARLKIAEFAVPSSYCEGLDWLYSESTDSTNKDVLKHFSTHKRQSIAVSEKQTAGRGRRGRKWVSPFAKNIYCTIGVVKEMDKLSPGLLSIVTGVSLCEAFQQLGLDQVKLKWPNDLLCQRGSLKPAKLGGILIESSSIQRSEYFFAIGFGVNVNLTQAEIDAIAQPAISLAQLADLKLSRSELLCALIESVIQAIVEFDEASVQPLIEKFNHVDLFHQQKIEVLLAGTNVIGINRGIDLNGQLKLETEQGISLHSAAEISMRAID